MILRDTPERGRGAAPETPLPETPLPETPLAEAPPAAAPDLREARAALDLLRAFAAAADPLEIAALDPAIAGLLPGAAGNDYPDFKRDYPAQFAPDAAYRATLPDLQNGPASLIVGAQTRIEHVGISNFRLPVRLKRRGGGEITVDASVTGTVSLDATAKGINMSRILRSFYGHAERDFSFEVMEHALDDYIAHLETLDARLQMRFAYPEKVRALRSGLEGWQYYDICLEVLDRGAERRRIVHLDYVYSSTCPCSLELSEHARRTRGQLATPHSQRSVARISAVVAEGGVLWFEDLIDLARRAVPTETQVMVKREDEQAFGELNAAHPIFVEDAVRAFAAGLLAEPRVGDFRIVASHQESLHSHDAVAVLTEGPTFAGLTLEPRLFGTLHHPG